MITPYSKCESKHAGSFSMTPLPCMNLKDELDGEVFMCIKQHVTTIKTHKLHSALKNVLPMG